MTGPDDFNLNCSECGECDCDIDHNNNHVEDALITDEDNFSIWGYEGDCA